MTLFPSGGPLSAPDRPALFVDTSTLNSTLDHRHECGSARSNVQEVASVLDESYPTFC